MSVPVPGEPSEQSVKVGQIFEAASAAPGYQPMRWQVSGFRSNGWCSVKSYPGGRSERPMRVASLLCPDLYREVFAKPKPDPSEQALPFSEAARKAAARAWTGDIFDNWVTHKNDRLRSVREAADLCIARATDKASAALTAAVDADPRLKAFLKLAALSDEERVERVAVALRVEGAALAPMRHYRTQALAVLADLGLPVAEEEGKG